ncbi:MAG: hypothetical protein JNL57_13435 [Bacteroidetes bacterium]|nr:hypothetical protein [Bacteroidota bacterium]
MHLAPDGTVMDCEPTDGLEFTPDGLNKKKMHIEGTDPETGYTRAHVAGFEVQLKPFGSNGVYLGQIIAENQIARMPAGFYKRVLDNFPSDIAVFTPDKKYRYININAVKDSATRNWLIGRDDLEYCEYRNLDPNIGRHRQQLFDRALQNYMNPLSFEEHTHVNGDKWHIRVFKALLNEKKEPEYIIGYGLDTTDYKLQVQQFADLRSRFINLASHEFRTPLTAIQSAAQLIELLQEKKAKPEDIQHYLKQIQDQVNRLNTIMEDILMLGKLEAAKLPFQPKPIHVWPAMEEVCNILRSGNPELGEPHVVIEGEPRPVLLDPVLFPIIVNNVLTNALKYARDCDGIEIKVQFLPEEVRICVADDGIGIPESELPFIGNSFFRASNSESFPGTGLGLTIVKELVKYHQGYFQIDSTLNKGTTVTISFPDFQKPQKNG